MINRHSLLLNSFRTIDVICSCCGKKSEFNVHLKKMPKKYSRFKYKCENCQIKTDHIVIGNLEEIKEKLRFIQSPNIYEEEVMKLLEIGPQKANVKR